MNSDQALIACAVDEASSKGALRNNGTYNGRLNTLYLVSFNRN